MKHIWTGKQGEQLAAKWLQTNGYQIVSRNWRSGRYEIDIVAMRNSVFYCCEVKTRLGETYGYPEESIGRKKLKNMLQAANLFEAMQTGHFVVQVNIISVKIVSGEVTYFLIEDADLNYRL